MDEYIGVIKIFAGNFAPRGYLFCYGQLLAISGNEALFTILGTTYGGNGQTTFAIPDLRGRVAIGFGQGNGLSSYNLGQMGGAETVALNASQMPIHTHALNVNNSNANVHTPTTASSIAATMDVNGDIGQGFTSASPNLPLNSASVSSAGSGLPHENRSPYLGVAYIICTEGIFPQRS